MDPPSDLSITSHLGNICRRNEEQETPLILAAKGNSPAKVALLLRGLQLATGKNISAKSYWGFGLWKYQEGYSYISEDGEDEEDVENEDQNDVDDGDDTMEDDGDDDVIDNDNVHKDGGDDDAAGDEDAGNDDDDVDHQSGVSTHKPASISTHHTFDVLQDNDFPSTLSRATRRKSSGELLSARARSIVLNSRDRRGWTALHHAANHGNSEIVHLLVNQRNIDVTPPVRR